jgi:two-component system sensor histidine kinase ChvG
MSSPEGRGGWLARIARRVRGLGARLLLVNAVVLVVPWAGLEYARWHERQLLASLESDLRNQAVVVRATIEARLAAGEAIDAVLDGDGALGAALVTAAEETRTRIRVLDAQGETRVDSHRDGPPEGPEPSVPSLLPLPPASDVRVPHRGDARTTHAVSWPAIPSRHEVRAALAGAPSAATRVRDAAPRVVLFLSEPVRDAEQHVVGAVYVTRSTSPVMQQMHQLRRSLIRLLAISLALTAVITLVLAWTITRPIERLAAAARRITAGEREVPVPRAGSGEVRELADALSVMVERQEARLRYVTEFTADVAHELKSPLTSIRGAAELLQGGAFDDEAARARFLRNIELDAERLDRLVSRLLELSRIDASREPLVRVDVDEVVRRVVERTDSGEQPVRVSGTTGLAVLGRALDLERALLNLVENALRFSPPDVPVRIELAREGGRVRIAVADEGPGVPEANREKVFQRFFTTDAEHTGTGLGLAIVASVAAASGGRALLDRTERGARFVIELAAAEWKGGMVE